MRRELFTYLKDCNETMEEFQEMIDLGPALREEDESELQDTPGDQDDAWEAFLSGQGQQYTLEELPVATAVVALVKCSRGCTNLMLQLGEVIGQQLQEDTRPPQDQILLDWLARAHELGRAVGGGATDLGATLYPPLQLDPLTVQAERQANDMENLLNFVLDAYSEGMDGTIELSQPVIDLATNLNDATQKRRREASEAIVAITKHL
jgi:hypothetical protein